MENIQINIEVMNRSKCYGVSNKDNSLMSAPAISSKPLSAKKALKAQIATGNKDGAPRPCRKIKLFAGITTWRNYFSLKKVRHGPWRSATTIIIILLREVSLRP